jgi:hypothetical protein
MPSPAARRRGTTLAVLLAAGAAALAGAGPGPPAVSEAGPCAPTCALAGFADLVERARPAVVAIAGAERAPAAVAADTTSLQAAA